MDNILTPVEIRVLGCLIEKEATTPDQYPLSLNALTNACNQKSNRQPVMDLNENTVLDAVKSLITKTLVSSRSGASSRVTKYAHRLKDRLFDEMRFSSGELGILAMLFLRGAQTIGEIRTRCARIHDFSDLAEISAVLETLIARPDGPFVVEITRQAGQKENRYTHLFGGDLDDETTSSTDSQTVVGDDSNMRLQALEIKITQQAQELNELKQKLEEFIRQFD